MPANKIYVNVSGWAPIGSAVADNTLYNFNFNLGDAAQFPDATALPANLIALVEFDVLYNNTDLNTSSGSFSVFQGYNRFSSGSFVPFGSRSVAGDDGNLALITTTATGTSARLQLTTHATNGAGFITVAASVRLMQGFV